MKKILLFFGILTSLSLHAVAWGDMADNGVECSVIMEKTTFDPRAAFPDFTLVFTNKGKKTVRLFDDFYPSKGNGPNISIEIWDKKRVGIKRGRHTFPIANYGPSYRAELVFDQMKYITLNPGEKHEVPIKDAYLLLRYLKRLASGKSYVMEVSFRDGYGDPGTRREYVGKKDFFVIDQTPNANLGN